MPSIKQPGDVRLARRPTRNGAKEILIGLQEAAYEAQKLSALFQVLSQQGLSADEILRDVGVSADQILSPATRLSRGQLLAACRNAIALSKDRHTPFRVGASIHLSAYGMYGFAILCCPDFRKAIDFALRYHVLAAPLTTVEFHEQDGLATWSIEPLTQAVTDPDLYRFITEMQISIQISMMRDIMGPAFTPREIKLSYPESSRSALPTEELDCDVSFSAQRNQMSFDASWLDGPPLLSNRVTYPNLLEICDDLLAELELKFGLAGKIRLLLVQDIANPPTISAIASSLGIHERSLRRQLHEQGLSFRGLIDELRTILALRYLRTTALSSEDIAAALGFSDTANFRRAFHRWTGTSPSKIKTE